MTRIRCDRHGGLGRARRSISTASAAASTCARPSRSDPGRFDGAQPVRRRTSSPTCRRTCSTRDRAAAARRSRARCGLEAHRDAMFAGERDQRHRGPRGLHTGCCARRAARGDPDAAARCTATLDAMLAYAETGARATRAHHRRREHRHRRLRPRAADGGAGARRRSSRRASASTSSPTSTATSSPRVLRRLRPASTLFLDRLARPSPPPRP